MDKVASAAALLLENRARRQTIDNLPADIRPVDLSSSYAVQDEVVRQMLQNESGQLAGYKIAATNKIAMELLKVEAPLFGRLLSSRVYNAPVRLPADRFRVRCLEPEFAFEMGEEVPRSAEAYVAESIAKYVTAMRPSIEIVDHHFDDWSQVGGFVLAADNAIHGGWVTGEPSRDWDVQQLASHPVQLFVNGSLQSSGTGAKVMGNPLNVLAWLANELPKFGLSLQRGDFVTTGVATDVYLAEAGDEIDADFGTFGRVQLSFD